VEASMGSVAADLRVSDARLARVWEKVHGGERLDLADGMACLETDDLLGLGRMADHVKRQKSGDWVYFVINRYVNPTNVCVLSCSFCDFAKKKGEAGAFEHSIEDIVGMIEADVREVHIVGGHHPDWPFEYYERLVQTIHAARPDAQIKAFTAAEIDYLWRRWKIEPSEALARLKAAGLHTMPGGGAEIFSARLQKVLRFTGKAGADRWLEIHRIAHGLGIRSNATILYGHVETYAERVEHLLRLRALQDQTAGFLTFIPLLYQVGDTRLVPRQASPIEGLRMVATSRLVLDNFPHIEAYWIMIGEETASVALNFGASDVNGTLEDEKIAHMALAESPPGLAQEQILRMIRDAGKVAVERDALYNVVKVWN
jgi:aminodeoxyfutalosine synthase